MTAATHAGRHARQVFSDPHDALLLPPVASGCRTVGVHVNLEDVEWMADTGETLSRAASRLGMSADALERQLRRRGRADLVQRLTPLDLRGTKYEREAS